MRASNRALISVIPLLVLFLSPRAMGFDNGDVLQLLEAKLSEPLILQAIDAAASPTFDTSAAGIIGLKRAGATDAIIQKVLSRQASNSGPAPAVATPSGGACNPEAPNMENRMAMRAESRLIAMTYKTPTISNKSTTGNAIASALTAGIVSSKGHSFLRIAGAHSTLQIKDRTPQFLDVLTPVGAAPEDVFYLVRLSEDKGFRTIMISTAEVGLLSGANSRMEIRDEDKVPLSAEKLADDCKWQGKTWTHYRVKPSVPLTDGEYGLLAGKLVFDFAVASN